MNFYNYKITSEYGERTDPITGASANHNGQDYALPLNTNVLSNISGTVDTVAYDKDGYGNYVVVKDGTGRLHYYAHLNKSSVNVGDVVSVGDVLGLSGSTGRSTGAHLHYEVKNTDGTRIDPDMFTTGDYTISNTDSDDNYIVRWLKNTLKPIVFNSMKYLIIVLLIILFVIFVIKSLDLSII